MTGDPKRIDDVLCRVDGLVTPWKTWPLTWHQCSQYWKYVMERLQDWSPPITHPSILTLEVDTVILLGYLVMFGFFPNHKKGFLLWWKMITVPKHRWKWTFLKLSSVPTPLPRWNGVYLNYLCCCVLSFLCLWAYIFKNFPFIILTSERERTDWSSSWSAIYLWASAS